MSQHPRADGGLALTLPCVRDVTDDGGGLVGVGAVVDDEGAVLQLNDVAHADEVLGILHLRHVAFVLAVGGGGGHGRQGVGSVGRDGDAQLSRGLDPVDMSHGAVAYEGGGGILALDDGAVLLVASTRIVGRHRLKVLGGLAVIGVDHGAVFTLVDDIGGSVCLREGDLGGQRRLGLGDLLRGLLRRGLGRLFGGGLGRRVRGVGRQGGLVGCVPLVAGEHGQSHSQSKQGSDQKTQSGVLHGQIPFKKIMALPIISIMPLYHIDASLSRENAMKTV